MLILPRLAYEIDPDRLHVSLFSSELENISCDNLFRLERFGKKWGCIVSLQ